MRNLTGKAIGLALAVFTLAIGPGLLKANAQTARQANLQCRFTSGPKTGQTLDYTPSNRIAAGSPCQDGAGSTGTVVAATGTAGNNNGDRGNNDRSGTPASKPDTLCRFTFGPKNGQTQDYAPGGRVAIGSPCQDGAGSVGTVISATGANIAGEIVNGDRGNDDREGRGTRSDALCRFTYGPKTGQTQDYAPGGGRVAIGSSCQDGAGSVGTVISATGANIPGEIVNGGRGNGGLESRGIQLSTLCRFTTGPRAGAIQNYPALDPVPVGSQCQDGAGSAGTVVTAQR